MNRAVRVTLSLLALAGLTTTGGCALPPRIEIVSDDGPPRALEPFDWPRPIRVGVLTNHGGHDLLHERVMRSLSDGVDRLTRDYRPSSTDRVDYVVDVGLDVVGDGRLSNFFAVFP